jgi:hypothetical protein
MCTLDKSHATLMTFLDTREVNSMLDYDTLDIGTLDITASLFFLSVFVCVCKYLSLQFLSFCTCL